MTTETDSPTVNIPLLRKAVEWAEAEAALGAEGRWDQGRWIDGDAATCGTSYCIAGWTLHAAGYSDEAIRAADSDVPAEAGELLGIGRDSYWFAEGRHLFDAENSIEDVRRIAEELAGERL